MRCSVKILMLVNWKVAYENQIPEGKQPPDYVVPGQKYWFFRYLSDDISVDVVDIRSFPWLEQFEKEKIRFYIWQTLKVLPKLNQYDLVLSHGMQSGIVLCLWRRLFGHGKYKHIVFDIGGFNSAKEEGKALKLMQFASKSLDGVIYHTKSQITYYEKCHPWLLSKSRYIAFGTDAEYFQPTGTPIEKENPYILCVGYNKRDWDTLLQAYEKLPDVLRHSLFIPFLPNRIHGVLSEFFGKLRILYQSLHLFCKLFRIFRLIEQAILSVCHIISQAGDICRNHRFF